MSAGAGGAVSILGYSQEYSSPGCRPPYLDGISWVQLLGMVRQSASRETKAMRWEIRGVASSDPREDGMAARPLLRRPSPPQTRTVQQGSAEQDHHDIERLPRAESEPVGGIVSEEVDEDAGERVPEHEGCGRTRRPVRLPDPQQVRHEQQVLRPVVQHYRVAKPVRIRKLDRRYNRKLCMRV